LRIRRTLKIFKKNKDEFNVRKILEKKRKKNKFEEAKKPENFELIVMFFVEVFVQM